MITAITELEVPGLLDDGTSETLRIPDELLTQAGIPRRDDEEDAIARDKPLVRFGVEHGAFFKYFHSTTLKPEVDRYGAAIEADAKRCATSADLPSTAPPEHSGDFTANIKQAARDLGFAMIGFARYDPRYTFVDRREWVQFESVICLAVEQDYEATQKAPSLDTEMEVWDEYLQLGRLGLKLGDAIRDMGYRAQVHPPNQSSCVVMPYFVEAGLGQVGANGQLLSPHFGSRARLSIVMTDAPVTYGTPVDFGVPGLCRECQICVRRCPGRALAAKPVWWRGVQKFKVDIQRCMPMIQRYDGCAVCMKVCPVQRFGLSEVMRHYVAGDGEILGKGSRELEGFLLEDKGSFGPNELPKFTKEDFEVPDGPLDKTDGNGFIVGL